MRGPFRVPRPECSPHARPTRRPRRWGTRAAHSHRRAYWAVRMRGGRRSRADPSPRARARRPPVVSWAPEPLVRSGRFALLAVAPAGARRARSVEGVTLDVWGRGRAVGAATPRPAPSASARTCRSAEYDRTTATRESRCSMSDRKPSHPADGGAARSRTGCALMAGLLSAMMLGGTIPIPLYVLYRARMGFGHLTVTVVFALYVIGTLFALLFFGGLSDHIGRKRVLVRGDRAGRREHRCLPRRRRRADARGGPGAQWLRGRSRHGHRHRGHRRTAPARRPPCRGRRRVRRQHDRPGPRAAARGRAGPVRPGAPHTVFWVYLGITAAALVGLSPIPETAARRDGG